MKTKYQIARKFRKEVLKNRTASEIHAESILRKYGVDFEREQNVYPMEGKFYRVDFAIFSKPKRFIEIDGSAHDGRQVEDKERERQIKGTIWRNFKFLRVKNEEVWDGTFEKIVKKLYGIRRPR